MVMVMSCVNICLMISSRFGFLVSVVIWVYDKF